MDTHPFRTASSDSTSDGIRKRVCKACDRCRLKKSKCDGSNPCSRCKADNAICVFGERKKSHDKVYPKGYVEMLEQQQGQLVFGLQDMYRRLLSGQSWPGQALSETNGHPLTHDILATLNLLETRHDGSGEFEAFEEDFDKLQSRLIANGAGYTRRRGSISSDSEHSQQAPTRSSSHSTPSISRAPIFDRNFTFSNSSTPLTQSPAPRHRQSYPPAHQSPLHRNTPLSIDSPLYQSEWQTSTFTEPHEIMHAKYVMHAPRIQDAEEDRHMMEHYSLYDDQGSYDEFNPQLDPFEQQLSPMYGDIPASSNWPTSINPMDLIQMATSYTQ